MKKLKLFILFGILYHSAISQTLYDSALKKYYAGELEKAIDLFSKCIANDDHLPFAYMYRGSAKAFSGNFEDAFKDLNASVMLDSSTNKIYYYFGKFYLLKKEYSLAHKYFMASIRKRGDDPEAFDGIATADIFMTNYNAAIKNETLAINLDSTRSDYFINRGFAKLKLGLFSNSIADLSKALSMEIDYKAYLDRASAYLGLKMYQEAINDYTSSLSIYADNGEALYFRGLTFKLLKKTNEACIDFRKSSSLGFAEATPYLNSYCR